MIPPNYSNQGGQQQPQQQQGFNYTVPPAPPPANQPPPKQKSPMGALLPVALSVGFLMLVGIAYLTYNSINATRALEQTVAEYQEAEKLRTELQSQYDQAIADLDKLKGDNEAINQVIEQQKAELTTQKTQIDGLLREKKQLDAARNEIAKLNGKIAQYVAQIEQLQAEHEQLALANAALKEETTTLATTISARTLESEELNASQAQLLVERDEAKKAVKLGSVIKVKNVKVTGQKAKKGDKAASREKAKRVDQLKVCFTTIANDLVEPGKEQFFIRIINPGGETLAIDNLGSGVILNSKTGEEIQYTQVKEYDYANDEAELCFLWNPGATFAKGKYNVEIYNKEHLAGAGSFELK